MCYYIGVICVELAIRSHKCAKGIHSLYVVTNMDFFDNDDMQ